MALKLTMAFSDNPRIQPLKDGTIKPENINLEVVTIDSGILFHRNLAYGLEFDVSEMSISETLLAKERNETLGGGKWDWTPIPVFMSRGQFWANLHVNTSSGIERFEDLKGKRIGVPDYIMTAALWFRVTLKELYGIEAWDNIWYNGRTKELSHGGSMGFHLKGHGVANGVTHHWLTAGQTMDVMLDRGELDAIIPLNMSGGITAGDSTVIDRYGGTRMTDNPRIRRLVNDQGKAVISEFFHRTGVYHANHHVVVKNSLLREHPWVAMELYKAFQRSKEAAYERARKAQSAYLYFEGNDWKEQAAIFGKDPYPLGLRAMRKTVERAIQGSLEQGLIRKPVKVEDLYFHTTLDT
jgi:4,5-dihydroxyphthalate decarboxylase